MLPTHKAVRDLLSDRTGRAVSLAPALPYAPGSRERVTYAVFVDAQLRTRAVAVCDLTLSVLLGAAGARIPVGGTEAEIARQWLAPGTTRHLRRLMEELAALLDASGEVRLHEMYVPGVQPPTDVPAYAHTLGRRLDLEVEVSSYGGGRLSVVCPAV
jgi:hypothetical protein